MGKEIRLGLYGINGHQVAPVLPSDVRARVVAVADYPSSRLDEALPAAARGDVREYATLDELLNDPDVDMVSLCSPRRNEQAAHAVQCLEAGKHVYAEKPAAFDSAELARILDTAQRTGKVFRDMGGSQLDPSLQAIRQLVMDGSLGEIVHVQAHKSYPWFDARPQDFAVDGGLIRQVGIHAARFIIGVTGQHITAVSACATGKGNPGNGDIYMAAVVNCRLESGIVACMNLNYLNPFQELGVWGNDQFRIFGTNGMAESVDGLRRSHLYLKGRESTELPLPEPLISGNYLFHYVNELLDGTPLPISFEDDLAALRAVNAAHEAARTGAWVTVE